MAMPTPTLLIVGSTAVGKTAALDALVQDSRCPPLEIISADSRQVYTFMDIGTAKPTPQERARAPYHVIDMISPQESWDVGQFVETADSLIPLIRDRGAVPVICGGTGFYHQGFMYGLPGTPRASHELRHHLEQRVHREGLEALRSELRTVDPLSEQRIAPNDRYRVIRALEVYHTSGNPLSSYTNPSTPRPGVSPVVVGLYRSRDELYRRIAARVERMFKAGLPDEVVRLLEMGYSPSDPGLQTIGYREFFEIGGPPPWRTPVLDQVRAMVERNTRRYAKRQETFFRRFPRVQWVPAEDDQALRDACAAVLDTHR
ncbi:MAG: tRNA (adenosine(37)-N6)-dimethylallyltransferase MiaA [Alkalispirochaeta sp.]